MESVWRRAANSCSICAAQVGAVSGGGEAGTRRGRTGTAADEADFPPWADPFVVYARAVVVPAAIGAGERGLQHTVRRAAERRVGSAGADQESERSGATARGTAHPFRGQG